MGFTLVIAQVVNTLRPIDLELELCVAVAEPVASHIHSLGLTLFEDAGEFSHGPFMI
jgi:hypothetical protein